MKMSALGILKSLTLVSNMTKPLREMIFRDIDGIWRDCSTGAVLADVLSEYDIMVDDRAEFMRLRDYDRNVSIWYRASAGRVKITIWKL